MSHRRPHRPLERHGQKSRLVRVRLRVKVRLHLLHRSSVTKTRAGYTRGVDCCIAHAPGTAPQPSPQGNADAGPDLAIEINIPLPKKCGAVPCLCLVCRYCTVYRLRRIRRSARALPLLGRMACARLVGSRGAGPRDKHMVPQRRCAALASDMRRGRQHMRAHPLRQRDFVLGRGTPALKDSCCSISARAEVRQATPVRRVA